MLQRALSSQDAKGLLLGIPEKENVVQAAIKDHIDKFIAKQAEVPKTT